MCAGYDLEHLITQCPGCACFFAACCLHGTFGGNLALPNEDPCHHFQLVFINGTCSNNGRDVAKAGLGMTIGDDKEYCWSITVEDVVDSDGPRTNQPAEMLAAIEGLKKLEGENHIQAIHEAMGKGDSHHKSARHHTDVLSSTYIIMANSEYVVKGITEWLPTWCVRLS